MPCSYEVGAMGRFTLLRYLSELWLRVPSVWLLETRESNHLGVQGGFKPSIYLCVYIIYPSYGALCRTIISIYIKFCLYRSSIATRRIAGQLYVIYINIYTYIHTYPYHIYIYICACIIYPSYGALCYTIVSIHIQFRLYRSSIATQQLVTNMRSS